MQLKQVTPTKVSVGDMEFYIRPFPAFRAANITGELASVLAPLLGVLAPLVSEGGGRKQEASEEEASGAEQEESVLDLDAAKAAEAMTHCPSINGDRMEKLMKKLLLGGHIAVELEDENGETEEHRLTQDLADEIFCGDSQHLFVLCYHVIRLNYQGFFEKLSDLSGKAESVRTLREIL